MRLCQIGFVSILPLCLAAGSCDPVIEYVPVTPDVPQELRQPVPVPERKAETLADVGLILTDHVEALGKANGKIVAIDCILTDAEGGDCDPGSGVQLR